MAAAQSLSALKLRPACADDEALLFELFAADKRAEFAAAGVPAAQAEMLVDMQYRARRQSYSQNYPEAMDTILCLEDGTPVGRSLVDRQTDCYHCIDLAVLPGYRNRGVGAWAIRQIQHLAALESVVLRLHVLKNNPALRLYERLGFLRVSGDEMSYEMEWRPPSIAASESNIEPRIALPNGAGISREDALARIFAFLREIGLAIRFEPVPSGFLPGIQMVSCGLRVDVDALLHGP
ncbi:MAG: GNAT family N-acetyltransferase [Terracidiphilus sp.]